MSAPLFSGDVLFHQRLLASAGFYAGKLDGDWGPKTDRAAAAWDEAFAAIRRDLGEFDGRTEGNLRTLLPGAQVRMRRLLVVLRAEGLDARVLSGTRTYAEQDGLFRIGRYGDPRRTVTKARGGQSNHNFGIALDVGLFDGGRYLVESPLYDKAGRLAARVPGVEWGGLWRSFPDRPHYQAETGLSLAELRARFERGAAILPYVPASESPGLAAQAG